LPEIKLESRQDEPELQDWGGLESWPTEREVTTLGEPEESRRRRRRQYWKKTE
jgi:hypothetical protein